MNVFITVEGTSDAKVYKHWIPHVNKQLIYSGSKVSDLDKNNFAILTGGGWPYYKRIIQNAIKDVNDTDNVDRLVISIDAEEMTSQEKMDEIQNYIHFSCDPCNIPIYIVVQNFCLETWALGNRAYGPGNPIGNKLKEYKNLHCVYTNDPELLPKYLPKYITRAQFAKDYLKTMINDKNPALSYSEKRPNAIFGGAYFDEIKNRHIQTGHISSFSNFLNAFS